MNINKTMLLIATISVSQAFSMKKGDFGYNYLNNNNDINIKEEKKGYTALMLAGPKVASTENYKNYSFEFYELNGAILDLKLNKVAEILNKIPKINDERYNSIMKTVVYKLDYLNEVLADRELRSEHGRIIDEHEILRKIRNLIDEKRANLN